MRKNIYRGAPSGTQGLEREISVWLPDDYENGGDRRYPVLYMHDGQNIWDDPAAPYGGWKMDTIAGECIARGEIEPIIIVGIGNTHKRNEEYVGFAAYYQHDPGTRNSYVTEAAVYTAQYASFVVDVVKPLIDRNYRTKPERECTALAGSSFGAGISYYTGFTYQKIFGKLAGLSYGCYNPAMKEWHERPFWVTAYLLDRVIKKDLPMQLYLDCGKLDLDEPFYPRAQELYQGLRAKGFTGEDELLFVTDAERGHTEAAWAARAGMVLRFLFGC